MVLMFRCLAKYLLHADLVVAWLEMTCATIL